MNWKRALRRSKVVPTVVCLGLLIIGVVRFSRGESQAEGLILIGAGGVIIGALSLWEDYKDPLG